MPEFTGLEAINIITGDNRFQDIPIIVVSSESETEDLVKAFEAGASDFISKPINRLELIARVSSTLRLKIEVNKRKENEAELLRVNEKLHQILTSMNDDLLSVGKMQRSLLPPENLKIKGIDFKWFYKPCEKMGGDLLNVIPINKRFCAFYLMDVSGHGIQAAILAISVYRMLSIRVGESSLLTEANGAVKSPAMVMEALNREFLIKKSDYRYFTMTYGLIDLQDKKIRFCRAGQTPLLLQNSENELEIIDKGNPPVGFIEDSTFTEFEIDFEKKARLIMFSDGFTEARGGKDGDFFGEDRFYRLIEKKYLLPLQKAVPQIVKEFYEWLEKNEPSDDIALLAIELEQN